MLQALSGDSSLNWKNVDLLIVYDDDKFRSPWGDVGGEKRGSLHSWEWCRTSPATATYRAAKPLGEGDDFNVEIATGHATRIYPSSPLSMRDEATCTLIEAIAWLAYRDETIAARYGAPVHSANHHGPRQRQHDLMFTRNAIESGLPGTEALAALADKQRVARENGDESVAQLCGEELVEAAREWESADARAWQEGTDKLTRSLRDGNRAVQRSIQLTEEVESATQHLG